MICSRRARLFNVSSTSIATRPRPVSSTPSGRCGRGSGADQAVLASCRSDSQPPSASCRSSSSRTSVTASMCAAIAGLGRQRRYGERATCTPNPLSQTSEGPSASNCLLSTQPALHQRSRNQRPARNERPINMASCSTVTANCSPTTASNSASRFEKRTLPRSPLLLRPPATFASFLNKLAEPIPSPFLSRSSSSSSFEPMTFFLDH